MSELPPLIQALLQPEAYPDSPRSIELVQTQISYVFLADDLVYKIKKPVDFGFPDWPLVYALLVEAHGPAGKAEEGLRVVTDALGLVEKTGFRLYEAELRRLQGELLLRQAASDSPQAETCLNRALDLARSQQAKSLELRASMSLSRLWQHQSKREQARGLLAEIYGWFTEGFDTSDLKEAKELLEKLSGQTLKLEQRPDRVGDVEHTLADITRAQQVLGYDPTTDFEGQVGIMVDWYKNGYPKD